MPEDIDYVALTIEVVANYVAHNNLRAEEVPAFIASTHAAITALSASPEPEPGVPDADPAPEYTPAVTVRRSLASREHIISLIDGKPYKTLKRHVARHGMTPAEYRERYGLKPDYPMTAPAYSEHRSEVAKSLGLGRKSKISEQVAPEPEQIAPEPEQAPEPRPTPAPAAKPSRKATAQPTAASSGVQPPKRRGRPPKAATVPQKEEPATPTAN